MSLQQQAHQVEEAAKIGQSKKQKHQNKILWNLIRIVTLDIQSEKFLVILLRNHEKVLWRLLRDKKDKKFQCFRPLKRTEHL